METEHTPHPFEHTVHSFEHTTHPFEHTAHSFEQSPFPRAKSLPIVIKSRRCTDRYIDDSIVEGKCQCCWSIVTHCCPFELKIRRSKQNGNPHPVLNLSSKKLQCSKTILFDCEICFNTIEHECDIIVG